jgi:hypothetical protein
MSNTFKFALKTLGWTAALAAAAAAVGCALVVCLDYFAGLSFVHGTAAAAALLNTLGLFALWGTRGEARGVGLRERAAAGLKSLVPASSPSLPKLPSVSRLAAAWPHLLAGVRGETAKGGTSTRRERSATSAYLSPSHRACAAGAPSAGAGRQSTDARRALAVVHSVIWGVSPGRNSPRSTPRQDGGFRHATQE